MSEPLEPLDLDRFHAPLPPGYAVLRLDDGAMHQWIRLDASGQDYDLESQIGWDKWAAWRGAWAHYRAEQAKQEPAT